MLPTRVCRDSPGVSNASLFLEKIKEHPPNEDEDEQRLARSRTLLRQCKEGIENDKLKECLEIHNNISPENAWSVPLIDTITNLLEGHNKLLTNFRVACPSLEASSKVYGLRVDSIYRDVVRISKGLAAKTVNSKNVELDNIDNVDDAADYINIANKSVAETQPDINAYPTKPKKRIRRQTSTVTTNKITLNGLLETITMPDNMMGKLNRVGGSIKSCNKRLMNNLLETWDYNLKLSTEFKYWTAFDKEGIDYTLKMEDYDIQCDIPANAIDEIKGEILHKPSEELLMRPLYTGYTISKKNKIMYNGEEVKENTSPIHVSDPDEPPRVLTPSELAVQFDMDAECEPVCVDPEAPMLDVDFSEYDALTLEEVTAINRCRGLRRSAQIMEDLRPIDSSSHLEYSYRPLSNISKFWTGPSHWKFKTLRSNPSTLPFSSNIQNRGIINQRGQVVKTRSKPLIFGGESKENLYLPYDSASYQQRRNNMYKKWDARKLRLPTDLLIEKNIFMRSWLAPRGYDIKSSKLRVTNSVVQPDEDEHGADKDTEHLQTDDVGSGVDSELKEYNATMLEIPTELDGAPPQVTKVVVPFAKRAHRIDMKNLKASCKSLLEKQFVDSAKEEEENKKSSEEKENKEPNYSDTFPDEKYEPGKASFKKMCSLLPDVVSKPNASSLTPIMSFYSLLHLANENNLRLSEVKDSDDIIIRKITTEEKKRDNHPSNS